MIKKAGHAGKAFRKRMVVLDLVYIKPSRITPKKNMSPNHCLRKKSI